MDDERVQEIKDRSDRLSRQGKDQDSSEEIEEDA